MSVGYGTYREIRNSLRTGDVYLVGGTAGVSLALELAQFSEWSHSGMVIRTSEIVGTGVSMPPDLPEYLLWESTFMIADKEKAAEKSVAHYEREYRKGEAKKLNGPMLVSLDERMKADIGVKLHTHYCFRPLHVERTGAMLRGLASFIDRVNQADLPYPSSTWKLIKEVWRGRFEDETPDDEKSWDVKKPFKSYECSELVAHSLMNLGALTYRHPPTSYMPRDFSSSGSPLLLRRAFFGPECLFDAL